MEFKLLKQKIFKLVDFDYSGDLECVDSDCVLASLKNGKGQVGGATIPQLARALFLFAQNVSEGKEEFFIEQRPQFSDLGVMLDVSRNPVMRVEKVKKYLDHLAALGFNKFMLYTEDVYEIKEYPMFGYLRGRYSCEELREIDDYAYELGIEVIPCIQTLGHLEHYIQWDSGLKVKDQFDVLLIDTPETYELIEAMIKNLRSAFRTNKIQIGVDEANKFALGRYLILYGEGQGYGHKNRLPLLARHLNKVTEYCTKYDFHPIMWSDMFYSMTSDLGRYEPWCGEFPDAVKDMAHIDKMAWNYTDNDKFIRALIERNGELGGKNIFAGGIDTWYAPLPLTKKCMKNNKVALNACIDAPDVDEVWATLWTGNYGECDMMFALPLLSIYSEYCYIGKECTETDIGKVSEYLTKVPFEVTLKMENISPEINERWSRVNPLLKGNLLYRIGMAEEDCKNLLSAAKEALPVFSDMAAKNDKNASLYEYASILFQVVEKKAELMLNLRSAYENGDLEYLKKAKDELLPELNELYEALEHKQCKNWMESYKAFGYEVIASAYGTQIMLNKKIIERLEDYLAGKINQIEELEEKLQDGGEARGADGNAFYTASMMH